MIHSAFDSAFPEQRVHVCAKLIHPPLAVKKVEADNPAIVCFNELMHYFGPALKFEQELFFPQVVCNQMFALRLYEYLPLFSSASQKQDVIRFKAFAAVEIVYMQLPCIIE